MNDLTESEATRTMPPISSLPRSHPSTDVVGQEPSETHTRAADNINLICDQLRELHRQRQDLHRSEKSMTLRIKAKCRRICDGDKKEAEVLYRSIQNGAGHEYALQALAVSEPFFKARSVLMAERLITEKQMETQVKLLPIIHVVDEIKGFGIGSLAAIIGECGSLGNYSTVSKLWKRLGLAVINGERQRRKTNPELALLHGYSPSRRSVMWTVGSCIMRSQSQRVDKETGEVKTEAGLYRKLYDERKAYEMPRVETKGHAHNRATRYVEKRLIRDLWVAWRKLMVREL